MPGTFIIIDSESLDVILTVFSPQLPPYLHLVTG
jgi:hypothetical protein